MLSVKSAVAKLLVIPSMLSGALAIVTYFTAGAAEARAVLAGGAVAIVGGGLIAWRMGTAVKSADPVVQLRRMYRDAFERFAVVCALLAAGLGLATFVPLYFVAGFAAGQLALMVSSVLTWKSVEWLPDSRHQSSTSSTTCKT